MTSNDSRGIQKSSISASVSGTRELTAEELERAIRLANIVVERAQVAPGSQQKDFDLAQKMRAKAAEQQNTNKPTIAEATAIQQHDDEYTIPDTPQLNQPMPQQKQALQPRRKKDDDWEARASKSIAEKSLSLDRQWQEKSWNNKSNVNERLKLLKDDGYDITPLHAHGVSSRQVTEAMLVHIKVRLSKKTTANGSPSSNVHENEAWPLPTSEAQEGSALLTSASDVIELDAAPESPDASAPARPYNERLTALPANRKRTRKDSEENYRFVRWCTTDLGTNKASTGPAFAMVESEQKMSTWGALKTKARNDIFRRSRHVARHAASVSRLIVTFPAQAAVVDVPGEIELSARGYELIMRDLRALSDTPGTYNDAMEISNPESVPAIAARVMQDLRMDPANCVINQQALNGAEKIRINTRIPLRTIIEGNAHTLAGLCSRLVKNGLIHREKGNFAETGLRLPEDRNRGPSELSYETCRVLGELEEKLKLQAASEIGGDIFVRWSHRAKR